MPAPRFPPGVKRVEFSQAPDFYRMGSLLRYINRLIRPIGGFFLFFHIGDASECGIMGVESESPDVLSGGTRELHTFGP